MARQTPNTETADLTIWGHGFYQIRAETRRGATFARKIQGCVNGVAYCDSTPYTQDIADGAVAAGLSVTVNGTPYAGDAR